MRTAEARAHPGAGRAGKEGQEAPCEAQHPGPTPGSQKKEEKSSSVSKEKPRLCRVVLEGREGGTRRRVAGRRPAQLCTRAASRDWPSPGPQCTPNARLKTQPRQSPSRGHAGRRGGPPAPDYGQGVQKHLHFPSICLFPSFRIQLRCCFEGKAFVISLGLADTLLKPLVALNCALEMMNTAVICVPPQPMTHPSSSFLALSEW